MRQIFLGLVFFLAAASPAWAHETFSYPELEDLIKTNQITTIEDLLPKLPETYRRFYTLVYQSRSSQKQAVSVDWPRIIFYGPDARFLMAFTHNPNTAPGSDEDDTIETIQYEDAKRAFTFRELNFHRGKSPIIPEPLVNPSECLECHGADPRPNWDSYNIWAGVYGSLSRLGCDAMEPGTPELTNYLNFLQSHRQSDRYQYLPPELNKLESCPSDPNVEQTFRNGSVLDPNADFTQKLFELNKFRIKRLVEQAPRYSEFKYLWTALARNCVGASAIESYFPAQYQQTTKAKTYHDELAEVVASARRDFDAQLADFKLNNRASTNQKLRTPVNFMDDHDPLGATFTHRFDVSLLKLVLDRMGLDIHRFSTNFTDGDLNFSTPTDSPSDIIKLWQEPDSEGLDKMQCSDLQSKSLASIQP